MDNSDLNIARDAYSSNDPYRNRDPYSNRDPYAGKSAHDTKDNAPGKEPSIYGYGHYCDSFFEIENLFRTKFIDDTQLHSEKRDYIGTGDMASVFPKMGRVIGSSFSIFLFTFILAVFVPFLYNSEIVKYVLYILVGVVFMWRFACPSYLINNAGQYIIGDEYKGLYKNFQMSIKFIEILNVIFATMFFIFFIRDNKSVPYLLQNILSFLHENMPLFKTYFMTLKERVYDFHPDITLFYLYLGALIFYHLFFLYINRIKIPKLRLSNIKNIKLKRLTNLYQRKSFILNGENF